MLLATYADGETAFFLGSFVAYLLGVIVIVSFIYGMLNKNVKPLTFSDEIEIGIIKDKPAPIQKTRSVPRPQPIATQVVNVEEDELKVLKRKVEIAKLKKQLHDLNNPKPPKESKPSKPPIFNDCVSALTTLGSPVRKAKAEAQNIFDRNPNIKTVQEFITEYGKR